MLASQKDHDLKRDRFIRELGVTVLRYWDNDVMKSTDIILQSIVDAVSKGVD